MRHLPALCLLAYTTSVFSFTLISFDGKPTRWANGNISYVVDSHGSKDFDGGCDAVGPCESERTAIRKAFQSWSGVSGVNLEFKEQTPQAFSTTGYDGKNAIIFVNQNWSGQAFSPPSGALAVTITTYRLSDSEILDADIHFNGQYFNWGVVNTEQERQTGHIVDVQNVAAHEVGHFLGLGHSSENYSESNIDLYMATMFFASGPGETFRRILRNDDLYAIQHLYPSGNVGTPEVDSVYPDYVDARTASSMILEIKGTGFRNTTSVGIARRSERGDVIGKVISRNSESMQVSFDTYGLGSGTYDIVVANSPTSQDRVDNALELTSYFDASDDTSAVGNYSYGEGGGCVAKGVSGLIQFLFMLGLPTILIFPGRLQRVTLRIKRHSRKIFFK